MIIKQVPMTPLGPSGLPHDLERFRPVEREEVKDCYIEILFTNSKYSRAPCNAINVLLQVQVVAGAGGCPTYRGVPPYSCQNYLGVRIVDFTRLPKRPKLFGLVEAPACGKGPRS